MCNMYWNLNTEIICPRCGKKDMWNLQTHFMGNIGSYSHYYKLGEEIPELEKGSIFLDGRNNNFGGHCLYCDAIFDLGAKIVGGKVERVWILKEIEL